MPLRLTEAAIRITSAINTFRADYHKDYFEVRPIARRWEAEQRPTQQVFTELARALHRVLTNWGAGKRKAPALRSEKDFVATFVEDRLHRNVSKLCQMSEVGLGVDAAHRRLINGSHVSTELKDFDDTLLSLLHEISQRLFINNTNVTYPMKVLLLISGLAPALDSKVRAGLGLAGFGGMDRTQFLLPNSAQSADGKKLTRLPFVLGECWTTFLAKFHEAIDGSDFVDLFQEPGRCFDVVFFMQATGNASLLTLDQEIEPWYDFD